MKAMFKRFVAWVRRMFHLYEKEINEFVNDMIDLAYQNMDTYITDHISPTIRRKIRNQVIADILINKIDIATIQGKSYVSAKVLGAIKEFAEESE